MTVFVDLEEAIMTNSLFFENLFISIRKYGFDFMKYINKVILTSVSYNPKTLSIMKEHYDLHTNNIYILCKPENKGYAEIFINKMHGVLPKMNVIEIQNNNKLDTIRGISEHFDYIGGSLKDISVYKKATASSIVSNMFSVVIHFFICNKSKDSRSTGLNGIISIFFRYFHLVLPIFTIWPAWMEVNDTIVNLNRIKAVFISSIGFFGFMNLFRALISLDVEREHFQNDIAPLCCSEFIQGTATISSAFVILIIFFIFGLYGIFVNVLGGLIGFGFSMIYFTVCYSGFWKKWTRMLLSCFIINLVFNPIFMKKLFRF